MERLKSKMNKTIQVETLHIDDETFRKMRVDADQVLQKLLKSMAEKGICFKTNYGKRTNEYL